MDNKETDIKDIFAQKRLIKTIISKGTKFSISYTIKARQKGWKGFFKPKVNEERQEEFVLKEPTLAVLDRASEVWLRMNTEAIEKEGADTIKEGFKLANDHAHDMAECLAILVLGEAYYAVDGGDDKELERLTDLFYKTVKPSQAEEIAMFVNATSNLVDFVNSMRLMKMSTTTTPTARIE
ncbi:MAG: hypothetical protein K6G25_06560 [Bacteroidales bacterium]|nr:hypothetical protein [Bacteroidales bacterium]